MVFSLALRDLGFTRRELKALKETLSVNFYSDFVAEVILRRNIRQFMAHVAEQSYYELDVRRAEHKHFGVGFDDGQVFFLFHVSRLGPHQISMARILSAHDRHQRR